MLTAAQDFSRHRSISASAAAGSLRLLLRPLQLIAAAPVFMFLLALLAMLLRPSEVPNPVDRIAFAFLVAGVVLRAAVLREQLLVVERTSWPMLGLTLLALASLLREPYDSEAWSVFAAKFLVPFTLFHLAAVVFTREKHFRKFEILTLVVFAYLSFTAIAFLIGAKFLIFPRFILDETTGYHLDRARGPMLQAVANGVALNLLGLLALHAYRRGRLRGLKALLLLGSVPFAILATMTRAVWLSFAATLLAVATTTKRWRPSAAIAFVFIVVLTVATVWICSSSLVQSLSERLEERGPVDYREAVYAGGWQMFLDRPLIGWGFHHMPSELPRYVTGYSLKLLYPHNTYLELLVEEGMAGLGLYVWLMWELWRLRRPSGPTKEDGFLNADFHRLWPVMLGVYWLNAAVVVMSYQFVNGLLFTLAGMLAGQRRRTRLSAC